MAEKTRIITLPNPNLRKPSKKIGHITEDVKNLADRMVKATMDWEDGREHELSVALAAVQIDELYKVVIIRDDFDDKSNMSFSVLINPEIAKYDGDILEDFEGCLSINKVYGKVPRYNKVKVKALNLDGEPIRISAEGFLARVLQHEIDHTKGKLFIDHIKESREAFYVLSETGKLVKMDYENDIENNRILW